MPRARTSATSESRAAAPEQVEISQEHSDDDGGVAARVQKRRRVSSHIATSPSKRIKREVHRPGAEEPKDAQEPTEPDVPNVTEKEAEDTVGSSQEAHMNEDGAGSGQQEEDADQAPVAEAAVQVAEEVMSELERQEETRIDGTGVYSDSASFSIDPELGSKVTVEPAGSQEGNFESGSQLTDRPTEWLRSSSLPLIDQLADQILETLSATTTPQLLELYDMPEQESSAAWREWISLFAHTKKLYNRDEHFLHSGPGAPGLESTFQMANLASAVLSLFDPQTGDFLRLHKHFSDLFLSPNEPLSEWQTYLWFQIKIRLFGYGMRFQEDLRVQLVNELFPADLEQTLRRRRLIDPHARLSDQESGFVALSQLMRSQLLPQGSQVPPGHEQDWRSCLRTVGPHLREHVRRTLEDLRTRRRCDVNKLGNEQDVQDSLGTNYLQRDHETRGYQEDGFDQDEMVRRAALAAHAALSGQNLPNPYETPQRSAGIHTSHGPMSLASAFPGHNLSQLQTDHAASTQEQYEKARSAAAAKAASKSRAVTLTPSQRRPWSTEEENALMTGLDRVQGPHWSQILELYGPGGTINEVLKDRNQVQLKDKARNLKLFFLKSGHAVPHYLKYVTGELKTRAPSQLMRNEMIDQAAHGPGGDDRNSERAAQRSIANGAGENESGAMSSADDSADAADDTEDLEQAPGTSQMGNDMSQAIQQALDGMAAAQREQVKPSIAA